MTQPKPSAFPTENLAQPLCACPDQACAERFRAMARQACERNPAPPAERKTYERVLRWHRRTVAEVALWWLRYGQPCPNAWRRSRCR